MDLVVVGAGTAGIPCAVEAARAGARVLLVDKADDVGGTLHVSSAHMSAGGSRRQRERGIEDTPAEHAADIARITDGRMRSDLVDLATRLAPGTVDWLADNGLEFAPESPRIVYGHEPYDRPRTVYGVDGGRSVLAVLRRLLDEAVRAGTVELRLGTSVEGLELGTEGEVTGVRLGGGETVAADAVVLTTGGTAAAPELFEELEGFPLFSAAWPTSTGDGLRMAREVGAAVAGQGSYLPTFGGLPGADGSRWVRFADRPLLTAAERSPWEVYVDRSGRRFVAEDEPSIDRKERALMRAVPDLTFWTVFDARALAESQPMVVGWSADDLHASVGRHAGVASGETLAELADSAGIEEAGLAATIERYNGFVAGGEDSDLGRAFLPAPIAEPPFYALRNHGTTLIAFSGVDVDGDLRVRRADGTAVEGLYAAGEVLGAAATSGAAFCGGMAATPALAFGRHLGKRLGTSLTTKTSDD